MNKHLHKLIATARKAHTATSATGEKPEFHRPPPAFSTRVAALWAQQPDATVLWERCAWRGLACSLAICALTAVARETFALPEPALNIEAMAGPGDDLF